MRGLGVGQPGHPRREAEARALPALGSSLLALLFENGMAMGVKWRRRWVLGEARVLLSSLTSGEVERS